MECFNTQEVWVIPGGFALYSLAEVCYLKEKYGDAVDFIPASPVDILRVTLCNELQEEELN